MQKQDVEGITPAPLTLALFPSIIMIKKRYAITMNHAMIVACSYKIIIAVAMSLFSVV